MFKLSMGLALLSLTIGLHAWEEDPRIEEHNKRTSYLLKLGNAQVEAKDKDTMDLLRLIHSERQKLEEIEHE